MASGTTEVCNSPAGQRRNGGTLTAFFALLVAAFASLALVGCNEPALNAVISADVTTGPAPLQITFTDTANVSADRREWSFSDGTETATTTDDVNSTTQSFTQAGQFTATLRAFRGEESVESSLTFTVMPGPLASFDVEGISEPVMAGEPANVTVVAHDEFGNVIDSPAVTLEVDGSAGSAQSGSSFMAGSAPGAFDDAVTVSVDAGGVVKSETFAVTVTPGSIRRVEIANSPIELGAGESV